MTTATSAKRSVHRRYMAKPLANRALRTQPASLGPLRILVCLFWLLTAACPARGSDELSLEYRVKAAFLLNFTRFIEWPPAAFPDEKSPISICIAGEDPFGQVIDDVVSEETANLRKLVVRRIQQPPTAGSCQVLFFERADKETRNILAGVGPGVLTVGEGDSFIREGGVIAFVLENRRVRFDINRTAATRAELKMNAKLLSVARSVGGGAR